MQCNSCNARYAATQADGSTYFHACAPVKPDANGNQTEVANKRDENVTVDSKGVYKGIVAAGLGSIVAPSQTQVNNPQ